MNTFRLQYTRIEVNSKHTLPTFMKITYKITYKLYIHILQLETNVLCMQMSSLVFIDSN